MKHFKNICILLEYNIPLLFFNKAIIRNPLTVHNVVPLKIFIFSHLIFSNCHVISTTVIVTSAAMPCYQHQAITMSPIDFTDWV